MEFIMKQTRSTFSRTQQGLHSWTTELFMLTQEKLLSVKTQVPYGLAIEQIKNIINHELVEQTSTLR